MNFFLEYWTTFEAIGIVCILAFVFQRLYISLKRRSANRANLSNTLAGRIGSVLLYVLRILAVGVGTFLAIAFFVMLERNVYSVITETRPAPSEVNLPMDVPFELQEVTFEGSDGLKMSGWNVPSQNGVTIILLHGYGANRTAMLWHAKRLVEAGYGVLLYDERASGESEGTRRSYGWEDPRDVEGAIHFIETESSHGSERIGVVGCSIGAQIALHSAAYQPALEAVWADGPASLRAQDLPASKHPIVALLVLGNYSLDWMYEIALDIEAPKPMVDMIGDIAPRPIMLVGGGVPQPLIGSEANMMIPGYAENAGSNAQVWIIPEAVHCDGPAHRPEEYAQRMVEFFDTAFGITR